MNQQQRMMLRHRYKIVKTLAKSQFGETFLAQDTRLQYEPLCVIKELNPIPSVNMEVAQRFFKREIKEIKEVRILSLLGEHPLIPSLLNKFQENGKFYLVQEYIEGHDLSQEIPNERQTQLSESYIIKLLKDTLEVLKFVHKHKVIHRDIKPANLIRRKRDGKIVLIDFGAVKEVITNIIRKDPTIIIGTPGYMPIEQEDGLPKFSSDIYALGIICLEALSGLDISRLSKNSQGEYCCAFLKRKKPVTPELAAILDKMVHSDWRQRYQTAAELLQELDPEELEKKSTININTKGPENIELISRFLGLTLLHGTIAWICESNNPSLPAVCQTGIQQFIYRLEGSPASKQSLAQAIRSSLLKAELKIAREYSEQQGGVFARSFATYLPTFWKFFPFQPQLKRDNLSWINQRIVQLNRDMKQINGESIQIETQFLERLDLFLSGARDVENIDKEKEQFFQLLIKVGQPYHYEQQLRHRLIDSTLANFANEMEQNEEVKDIFDSSLLSFINDQAKGLQLKVRDWTYFLRNSQLNLEEFHRKLEGFKCQIELEHSSKESKLELPQGQVPLQSPFYVERPPIEEDCYEAISKPGSLIRIKAAREMGKSSLMKRILHQAQEEGGQTVYLNFQLADGDCIQSLDNFLQWFCAAITNQLELEEKIQEYWSGPLGSKSKCTQYFQRYLLSEIASPIVLGLDEVDRVFEYRQIANDFFGLLRAWYEQGKNSALWQRLKLVIAHSQEVYIPLDINQSPFNVGLPIELPQFNQQQVQNLIKRHELNWSWAEVEKLIAMIGGHPYLLRQGLYEIARSRISLPDLLRIAPTEEGPYKDHLRRHLLNLEANPNLLAAMKQVLEVEDAVQIGTTEGFKLRSMGLVKLEGNAVLPLCNLYRLYLRDRIVI